MTKVKICCIQNIAEAQMALEEGADVLGLVSSMPSGPGVIEDDVLAEIAKYSRGKIETFLLTSENKPEKIIAQHQRFGTDAIQLVDSIEVSAYTLLRKNLPGVKLVQVIHVTSPESIDEAIRSSALADAILLDSGNPGLSVKVLGGTGKTHNWEISREIVKKSSVPVFLAGGLTPENVKPAVEFVKPYGVDVCSKLRDNGILNRDKLNSFIGEIRK